MRGLARAITPFLCHSRSPRGKRRRERRGRRGSNSQGRDGVLDRNASVTNELAPAGRDTDPRRAAAPARRFRHDRRSARLCGEGPARSQLPRRARHARPAPIPIAELREDALVARPPLHRARDQARRPHRAGRRDRTRVRRLLLRRGLCRRLAGAAAAADQLRRPRRLCRPARRPAEELRSGAVPLPARARRLLRSARPTRPASTSRDWETLDAIEPAAGELPAAEPDDIAYLQYSSGSTRFPHGVAVTHRALLDNLHAHGIGLQVEDTDRCISWLPWYHDMGLVGCFLSPIVAADVGRLSEDRGFRPAAARLARHDHPQSGHDRSAIRRPSATTSARAG